MIKKTILAIFFVCMIISCGKKGDPEYKDPSKQTKKDFISQITT